MTTGSLTPQQLIASAAAALDARKDEVNRLNVFPVPDGDTGTNMALTMEAVVTAVSGLPKDAAISEVCQAVAQGSLMGARGNSGVILSQILRGLCEVLGRAETIDGAALKVAFERAVQVAFQAVRKPVEGTMLTVLRDTAQEVAAAADEGVSLDSLLERLAEASKESVRRTPDLLPVLAEAGVVDAGGLGLAILAEGLVAALEGHDVREFDVTVEGGMAVSFEPVNDWHDDEFLYCTEFLLMGEALERDVIHEFVSSRGGSELVVGDEHVLKVHVHTDDPGAVLSHMTSIGEVAHVHINNMREQTAERQEGLSSPESTTPQKPLGVVAVSAGPGMTAILESLGVDRIVEGGQTMNPSTAQILEAADSVNADAVIILPNNKNIVMAAEQAAEMSSRTVRVVPTTSVPQAFAALLAFDSEGDLDDMVAEMEAAYASVRVAEVTTAVKDSHGAKVGDIRAGQVIGIAGGEIEVVGADVLDVAVELLSLIADGGETLTLLAGEDLADDALAELSQRLGDSFPSLEVDALRGEQPLYPLIMAVE